LDLVKNGTIEKGSNVVFIHTGGDFGLFGYEKALTDYIQHNPDTAVNYL
jgi:hypothetical protein